MRKTQPKGLKCLYLNRRQYESGRWERERWDAIVHLANIAPTRVLTHSCRVLYCSSGAVYHKAPDEYGLNKIRWENECLASGADVVIARLFTFYGDGLDDSKAIVQFTKRAKAGKPIEIWGDGNTARSYMGGTTMGRWMWGILLRGKTGEAYNVGSEKIVTILQLARAIAEKYPVPVKILGGKDRVTYYVPTDTEKTKLLLPEYNMV